MALYRVLVITNLWPHDADPSYGCFVQAQMESLRPLGVEYDLLFINGLESRWNYFRAVFQLWKRIRARRYDLIHAHMTLAGLIARCQVRLPLVVSFMGHDVSGKIKRSDHIPLYGRFYQVSSFILARLVSGVIVKTDELRRQLRFNAARVIPNGVDLGLFRPMDRDEARRALSLDRKKKFVLFPYNPAEERKRYDVVQAAVGLAQKQITELEILHARGLPQDRIPIYMNAADVLVLASQSEGSPNAVKEALAVNLPVIAVDVGDTAELLASTEGNYLVTREPEVIAAKIVEVCRCDTRARSRDRMAKLSMENVAKQIIDVYAGVLRERG